MKVTESQFKEIYKVYYPKIVRLCMGYSNGDESVAKDLSQDVFIKVWQNIESFRNEASISTWIYRITVNTCLSQIRKQNKVRFVPEDFSQFSIENEATSNEKEKRFYKLYECINKLNKINKSIILLELEAIPQQEIAVIIGISHEAVRTRINRIKTNLTNCVKK